MNTNPSVSVIVPVRNERDHIRQTLQRILEQDYPSNLVDILVVDGISDDGTAELAQEIAEAHKDSGPPIRVIPNPKRQVSSGLNIGLTHSTADLIARVDGHCEVGRQYLSRGIQTLVRVQADHVGAIQRARGKTRTGQAIAIATMNPFGIGNSNFRTSERSGWADQAWLGVFRRDAFERFGPFDESLPINEDDEFAFRMRRLGGKIYLDARLDATYICRNTFTELWQQYFRYGYFKVGVVKKTGRLLSARHLVPPAFATAIACLPILAFGLNRPQLMMIPALHLVLGLTAAAGRSRTARQVIDVYRAFCVLHLSYGFGVLTGVMRWSSFPSSPRAPSAPSHMSLGSDERATAEAARIRQVYEAYARDSAVQARWHAENRGNRISHAERNEEIAKQIHRLAVKNRRSLEVLDLGCGSAAMMRDLEVRSGPQHMFVGVDLMESLLKLSAPGEQLLVCGDAQRLPFLTGEFDIVIAATVFSSILDSSVRAKVAQEMDRVLNQGGSILLYDIRVPNPRNSNLSRVAMSSLHDLFPDYRIESNTHTLLPPLARRLPRVKTEFTYRQLSKIPFLMTHRLSVLTKS